MALSFGYILADLLIGIGLIVLLTTQFKIPAFFALVISAIVTGLGAQLPLAEVISTMKDGFGGILKSLGMIIVLGTALGVLLEYTRATTVMATYILKKLGEKRAPWAMSITGFIVGLPIFCDSGFVVLSGLNKDLAKRSGTPMSVMAGSLSTGLIAIHCMAPPHPGISAAGSLLGVDLGRIILYGAIIAIPSMIAGNLWSRYAGKKYPQFHTGDSETIAINTALPGVISSFAPIIIPILLIAIKSFFSLENGTGNKLLAGLLTLGDPIPAIMIGILLAFTGKTKWTKAEIAHLLHDGTEKAGGILIVIGAGGAFGAILTALKIGPYFSHALNLAGMGIFFPFLLTSILKTAQGSSTVAIITASSIVLPLVPVLGLDTESGRLLCVLAMGAGSLMIVHANDAFFWVIAKFSNLEMKVVLWVYSIATIWQGLVSLLMVYILSKFI